MKILQQLSEAIGSGQIEVIDLTSPLNAETPILQLPPEFGQTWPFQLELISDCDEQGPGWYWNNFRTGEHTGTHFDAPNHWVTGRDKEDIASVAPDKLLRPAAVIDVTDEVAQDVDFVLTVEHVKAWEAENGPLPEGGWLIVRTGWAPRTYDQDEALGNSETGPHSPGMTPECAQWLAEETPIQGIGVETVGTDGGIAHSFEPAFPCHSFMLGAGKYGITQLKNVDKLPTTGAMIVATPLPIVNGSGSPARVLALVERATS
ncbi:cyclase [Enemella evansiae]|uniref:cyclase family protein n=1 Tax=Enemella evansiae TaxID=2016499 RepID=UPI000B9648F6|nr:cyclase family protein [Enemella evansiae]OYO11019.1 cyclase [Enemella evansiae]